MKTMGNTMGNTIVQSTNNEGEREREREIDENNGKYNGRQQLSSLQTMKEKGKEGEIDDEESVKTKRWCYMQGYWSTVYEVASIEGVRARVINVVRSRVSGLRYEVLAWKCL